MKNKAFSLIEIAIVTAILGVLSSLIFVNVSDQFRKVRDARRKLDINAINKSLEEYYDSRLCYPQALPDCGYSFNLGASKLLSTMPCDPRLQKPYLYISDGNSCSSWFQLYTNFEVMDDSLIGYAGCRNGCGPECQYNYGVSSPNKDLDWCTPTITPSPILTFTPTYTPTSTPTPTPTPIQYVCSPASGPNPEGRCEPFAVPTLSECPKIYPNDSSCSFECWDKNNRCKNSKGKYKS